MKRCRIWLTLATVLLKFLCQSVFCMSPLLDSVKTTVSQEYEVLKAGERWKVRVDLGTLPQGNIIVGEHMRPDGRILISCTAWYPTNWVYSGDGMPDFMTNTSVSVAGSTSQEEMVGAQKFTAYLHIGYRRKLKLQDSGRYNCMMSSKDSGSGELYKTLAAFYHVYVPGDDLFLRKSGGKIVYNLNESPARIPCSVSHPKASVSLQKYKDGKLFFITKASNFYHPVSGFYPKQDIPGMYICTGALNEKVQMVHYRLIPASSNTTSTIDPDTGVFQTGTKKIAADSYLTYGTMDFEKPHSSTIHHIGKINRWSEGKPKPITPMRFSFPFDIKNKSSLKSNKLGIITSANKIHRPQKIQAAGVTTMPKIDYTTLQPAYSTHTRHTTEPTSCNQCGTGPTNINVFTDTQAKPSTTASTLTYPFSKDSLLFQIYFKDLKQGASLSDKVKEGKDSSYLQFLASLQSKTSNPTTETSESINNSFKSHLALPLEAFCSPSPCGKNAKCYVKRVYYSMNKMKQKEAACKCFEGMTGNPYMECFPPVQIQKNYISFNTSYGKANFQKRPGLSFSRNNSKFRKDLLPIEIVKSVSETGEQTAYSPLSPSI